MAKLLMKSMEINAATDPIALFQSWMNDAKAHAGIREATAMALATADKNGQVHVRVVLCKEWSDKGFVFFTNYQSQKGLDLAANPNAGAVFYWDPLFRQVKLTGTVEKTARAESESYWNSRPRDSQLSQWISKQSQPVESRSALEEAWRKAKAHFAGQSIPCPEHWGGYRLQPREIEFWIGQPGRLHDRFRFEKSGAAWTFCRLSP